ncbi:lipoprotein [Halomonas sp. DP8Y7-3]|nr:MULTISPECIES: lipoprotein [Halomonas]MBN8412942.1 lipoprotein [Halomonas litopenaei]MBY5929072.1 lipoprotein [Halomonas sp. DP8Y7-3]MBY5983658.1 lipoprotein [Halomonas sp. DP5Y7-2]
MSRATSALLLILLLAMTSLAGCGQKGPLYLPGDEEAAERYGPRDSVDQDDQGEDGNAQGQGQDQDGNTEGSDG